MAIIVFKVFTLVIRSVAKPLISWAAYYKKMKLQEPDTKFKIIKNRIIWVGQMTNFYTTKINRKLFSLPANDPIKPLQEDKAIEKGAEFISELLIYSVLIAIPVFEWYRQAKISKFKEAIKDQAIKRMNNDIVDILKENKQLKQELADIKNLILEIKNKV
jgi:hypothetical protein